MKKNLFNLGSSSELFQQLTGAFRALERGDKDFEFNGRTVGVRVNAKGRAFLELPAYFLVKFRIYQPEDGKSGLMAIIDDLYAHAGERNGKPVFENPILWGRIMRNANQGESLFFFNDPSSREALAAFKTALIEKGIATKEQLDEIEPAIEPAPREERVPVTLPSIGELPPLRTEKA